jgi:hypothetical protein
MFILRLIQTIPVTNQKVQVMILKVRLLNQIRMMKKAQYAILQSKDNQ